MNQVQSGFTLIELLATVAIAALIVGIAIPNYQNAILQTRRAEARSALHVVMMQQERYYTQHNTYAAFGGNSKNTNSTTSLFKWWSGQSVESSYYEINATPCPGQQLTECVLLTATSGTDNVKQVDDPICGKLMLDSTNNKSHSSSAKPNSLCW